MPGTRARLAAHGRMGPGPRQADNAPDKCDEYQGGPAISGHETVLAVKGHETVLTVTVAARELGSLLLFTFACARGRALCAFGLTHLLSHIRHKLTPCCARGRAMNPSRSRGAATITSARCSWDGNSDHAVGGSLGSSWVISSHSQLWQYLTQRSSGRTRSPQ